MQNRVAEDHNHAETAIALAKVGLATAWQLERAASTCFVWKVPTH